MEDLFDIFNPPVSTVAKGTEGKLMLFHSDERKLGKTLQATRFPKPYYLRFEQGINAIPNIPYAPLTKWSDFKRVNKKLTDPKTLDKAKELYSTIIVDTVDVAIKWCDKYVCSSQGVSRLNDGNDGFGLWKEYENEWFNEWNKLLNAGYCVIFIAHSEIRKKKDPRTGEEYEQMCPKGDKRTIDLIIDAVDLIGYIKSNGFDEDGNKLKSSIYFCDCPEFLGGSRFSHMVPEITPFTAEAVQEELAKAIEAEEAESGSKAVSYAEKQKQEDIHELTYDEAIKVVKPLFKKMHTKDAALTAQILEKYLGAGVKISETTEAQLEQVLMIIDDFKEELGE